MNKFLLQSCNYFAVIKNSKIVKSHINSNKILKKCISLNIHIIIVKFLTLRITIDKRDKQS